MGNSELDFDLWLSPNGCYKAGFCSHLYLKKEHQGCAIKMEEKANMWFVGGIWFPAIKVTPRQQLQCSAFSLCSDHSRLNLISQVTCEHGIFRWTNVLHINILTAALGSTLLNFPQVIIAMGHLRTQNSAFTKLVFPFSVVLSIFSYCSTSGS